MGADSLQKVVKMQEVSTLSSLLRLSEQRTANPSEVGTRAFSVLPPASFFSSVFWESGAVLFLNQFS